MKKFLFLCLKKISFLLSGTGIAKNNSLLSMYQLILSKLKPSIVITEGSKMLLDEKDSLLLSIYPNFEPGETEVIKRNLKLGMRVIDAGANIGYFTLLMSRLVGAKGMVYAFEPGSENIKLLKKNVLLNNYSNVDINESAISNKNGRIKFYLSSNPQDHRIIPERGEDRPVKYIKALTLDSYFNNNRIDFIKMDIQGAELLALKGARNILNKYKPNLILEFWPYGIIQSGNKPEDFLNFLIRYEYHIKQVNPKSGRLMKINEREIIFHNTKEDIFTIFCD